MLDLAQFLVTLLTLALAGWAFIDCAMRPAAAFPAVGRQTKPAWLIFLALAVFVIFFFGAISLLGMGGVVLSVYYLVDVRTKVLTISRR
ncbi:MAG: DUF2516 family protein [Actinobacteria bacterium]|nr:DUF2516 family protein [Actinomycetota bacterium]